MTTNKKVDNIFLTRDLEDTKNLMVSKGFPVTILGEEKELVAGIKYFELQETITQDGVDDNLALTANVEVGQGTEIMTASEEELAVMESTRQDAEDK